jgi:hypothetical protein
MYGKSDGNDDFDCNPSHMVGVMRLAAHVWFRVDLKAEKKLSGT